MSGIGSLKDIAPNGWEKHVRSALEDSVLEFYPN